ncbi:hypothetical protein [Rickettsia tamurae]|uniref:hypothetical protein n=1 Tax=Rickettsia tamurae TaxID=334545 RepID=UPI001BFEEB62|nr:hypothetical protein [Rickettsia tamurae]
MAVLLNELFFPEADARAASLYSAIACCSTYVFRPIGALIFGWIGDTIGRGHYYNFFNVALLSYNG